MSFINMQREDFLLVFDRRPVACSKRNSICHADREMGEGMEDEGINTDLLVQAEIVYLGY